jgi:SAM-dependent methyltransferase
MRRRFLATALLLGTLASLSAHADKDAIWNAFIAWFKTAPPAGNPLAGYGAKLQKEGKTPADVKQEIGLLTSLMAERSDWIGIYYDKVYVRPATGDPVADGFASNPSALVAEAISRVKPGTALDVGIGQGRNAVFLAQQGWAVTGFDISKEALAASQANARKAGVRLTTVHATYQAFDYGTERWDLIVLAFAWAPLDDPVFVARLQKSLRPGGRVVVEHFTQPAGPMAPNIMHKLAPNQLRSRFEGFDIAFYEEAEGVGDWGGPGSQLVKMIAVRR